MTRLAIVAVVTFLFGCAATRSAPAEAPEPDPWRDFKGTYSQPTTSAETASSPEPAPVAANDVSSDDHPTDAPKKHASPKKARKAPPVNGKKPRKRPKRAG